MENNEEIEETKEEEVIENEEQDSPSPEQEEAGEQDGEQEESGSEDDGDDEEERKRIAREKYKERQRQRQEDAERQQELQQKQETGTATKEELSENEALKKRIAEIEGFYKQQQYTQQVKAAEKELKQIEDNAKKDKDFVSAFPDYEDKVNNAIEFAKIRLMQQGMGESEAEEMVRMEKTLLADRAVANGQDPLEVIYQEAEQISNAFEQFAEKMGYTKGRPKTNLQAQREASKPNPMNSGSGKGSNAVTRKFDELGDEDMEEIKNTTIWDIK